ncbi:hypothetical protein [Paenibacillus lacisoli]|nr:hypothetical protein [Paenibacillus sp. JX-17]
MGKPLFNGVHTSGGWQGLMLMLGSALFMLVSIHEWYCYAAVWGSLFYSFFRLNRFGMGSEGLQLGMRWIPKEDIIHYERIPDSKQLRLWVDSQDKEMMLTTSEEHLGSEVEQKMKALLRL